MVRLFQKFPASGTEIEFLVPEIVKQRYQFRREGWDRGPGELLLRDDLNSAAVCKVVQHLRAETTLHETVEGSCYALVRLKEPDHEDVGCGDPVAGAVRGNDGNPADRPDDRYQYVAGVYNILLCLPVVWRKIDQARRFRQVTRAGKIPNGDDTVCPARVVG